MITRNSSVEVTPDHVCNVLADHVELLAGCYLFLVSNLGLRFSQSAITALPTSLSFLINCILSVTVNSDLRNWVKVKQHAT